MSPTSLLRGIAFLLLLQWVSTLIINALGVPFRPLFGNADFNGTSLRQRYSGKLHRGHLRYPDFQNGYAVFTGRRQRYIICRCYQS